MKDIQQMSLEELRVYAECLERYSERHVKFVEDLRNQHIQETLTIRHQLDEAVKLASELMKQLHPTPVFFGPGEIKILDDK